MTSRVRLLLVLLVCGAVISTMAVAVVAGVAAWGDAEGDEDPRVGRAVVIEDLCAVVEPRVPANLGLGTGTSRQEARGTGQRATCLLTSPGETELGVRVSSYALPEGDPHGMLDQLVGAACDTLEQQYGAGFSEMDHGCSGRDAESIEPTGRPSATTATSISAIPHLAATVTVTLTDRRTPAQVATYATAITYGMVSSDLAP